MNATHAQPPASPRRACVVRLRLLEAVLIVLAVLGGWYAYQAPLGVHQSLIHGYSPLQLLDVYPAERLSNSDYGWQRWTRLTSSLIVPAVGSRDSVLRLRFYGGNDPTRTLDVHARGDHLATVPLRTAWQDIWVRVPAAATDPWSGDLILDLSTTALPNPTDRRELGIALYEVQVIATPSPVQPPLVALLQLAALALAAQWSLRLAGVRAIPATLAAAGLLVAVLVLVAGWLAPFGPNHLHGLTAVNALTSTALLTLLLAAGLRWLTHPWQSVPARRAVVALRTAVLLLFALRLAGMLHPDFAHVDHHLRANQLVQIAGGNEQAVRAVLEQQFAWGTREPVPYSLVSYYLLVPLAWLFDGNPTWLASNNALLLSIKVTVSLLDASIPLLLWAVLRGSPWQWHAAAWAGLCYAALPVGYLFFHDGSFPTTIGVWTMWLALAAVRHVTLHPAHPTTHPTVRALPWLGVALLIALALAAYITHLVFVPVLVGGLCLSLFAFGTRTQRGIAGWLVAASVIAAFVAWLVEYLPYTLPVMQRTIPAFIAILQDEGAIIADTATVYGSPPKTLAQHLIAHFRVLPVVLASVALVRLLRDWRGAFITHIGVAWALFLIITQFTDGLFSLWDKHMYFAAPAVALFAGLALAWLAQRGTAGRVVGGAVLALLFASSLLAWSMRVFWFEVPLLAF